jgi:hypothetical protein
MADTMAVAQIEELLGPEEQVLAKLPCVGFDGFPDFAVGNDQQRIGECSISLIGSEKDPHCPLRLVFMHNGQLRSIEATEEVYQLPLVFADNMSARGQPPASSRPPWQLFTSGPSLLASLRTTWRRLP